MVDWFRKHKKIEWTNWVNSDSAPFYLKSFTNKKNDGIYLNPSEKVPYIPQDKFSPKTEVYASISSMGIAGPIFVDGNVNTQIYIAKVLPKIALEINKRKRKTDDPTTTRMVPNVRRYIFQQDLAPSHRSNRTQKFLKARLGKKFLSADKSPPAFVEWPIEQFWNAIKQEVYSKGKPKNMRQLKSRIRKAFKKFDFNWLKNTWNTMPDRINAVIAANGGHTKY